ncbi:hypothetical protein [Priestia megaterium]|uniref:hypothetical protein n=1 Tax=Priestia megaterium TaxID=1404 RepID=UPI0037CB3EC8
MGKQTKEEIIDPYAKSSNVIKRTTRGFRIEEDLFFIMDKLKQSADARGERDFLSNLANKLFRAEFEEKGLFKAYEQQLKDKNLWSKE